MWTENRLNDLLTTPSDALVVDMKQLPGDILVLGAGGKMGLSLYWYVFPKLSKISYDCLK